MDRLTKVLEQKKGLRIKHESNLNKIRNLHKKISDLQSEIVILNERLAEYEDKKPSNDVVFEIESEKVIRAIKQFYPEFGKWALTTRSRKREICTPRQIWQTIMLLKGYTQIYVGDYCGRDHSTLINSRKTIEDLCHIDRNVNKTFTEIVRLSK